MNAHRQTTAVAYDKTFPEAIHAQAALMIKNLIRQIGGVLPQQRSAISSLVLQLEPVVALAL